MLLLCTLTPWGCCCWLLLQGCFLLPVCRRKQVCRVDLYMPTEYNTHQPDAAPCALPCPCTAGGVCWQQAEPLSSQHNWMRAVKAACELATAVCCAASGLHIHLTALSTVQSGLGGGLAPHPEIYHQLVREHQHPVQHHPCHHHQRC